MLKRAIVLAFILSLGNIAWAQNNGAVLPAIPPTFFTATGIPASGAKLCTTASGTTNNLATYSNAALSSVLPNPITLSPGGIPQTAGFALTNIFIQAAAYRVALYLAGTGNTCNGTPVGFKVWQFDNIYDFGDLLLARSNTFSGTNIFNGATTFNGATSFTGTFSVGNLSVGPTTMLSTNATAFHAISQNWVYSKNPTLGTSGETNLFSGIQDNTVGAGKVLYGASLYSEFTGTSPSSGKTHIGAGLQCSSSGTGSLGGCYGLDSEAVMEVTSGNVSALLGGFFKVQNHSTSGASIAAGVYIDTSLNDGGGTLPALYAIRSASTDLSYLSGDFQVGVPATKFGRIFFAGDADPDGGALTMTMSGSSNGSLGSEFVGRKSRGTNAAPTDVGTADTLLGVISNAYSGGGYLSTASLTFETDGTFTTGQRPPTKAVIRCGPANTAVGPCLTMTSQPFLQLGTSYAGATLSAAGTVGLRNNSGTLEVSNNGGAWSTVAISTSGVTSTTMTNNGMVYATGANALASTIAPTNGQVFIGSTGTTPVLGTITGAGGLAVTNGAGTISISLPAITPGQLIVGTGLAGYTSSPYAVLSGSTLVLGALQLDGSGFGMGFGNVACFQAGTFCAVTLEAGNVEFFLNNNAGLSGVGATFSFIGYGGAGSTPMRIATDGNAFTSRVSLGAANSGGAGFRAMVVPN